MANAWAKPRPRHRLNERTTDKPHPGRVIPEATGGTSLTPGGIRPRPLPAPGFVRFRAVNQDHMGLVAELAGPVTTTGFNTYETVDRPQRVGLTNYTGRPPLGLTIPLLFDRWRSDGNDVEQEVRMLERMLGLDPAIHEGPVIIIEGLGVPHSYTRDPKRRWVLSGDPQWEDDTRLNELGLRSYVPVTVTATEWIRPDATAELADLNKQARDTRRQGEARRYFQVPAGTKLRTLREIARHFHVPWRNLRQLNHRLPGDPDNHLKPGTRVRVR